MDETLLENSADFIESLAIKYPGSRNDLLRLAQRVLMDARNAQNRTFSNIEFELARLRVDAKAKAEVQG